MPSLSVTCPTGLVVSIREFRVRDEDLLADPQAIRRGTATLKLLEAITESVDEPGPYSLRGPDQKLEWGDVLQGDLMFILLKNRIQTWGPKILDKQPCPNCQQQVESQIDLEELAVQELPGFSRAHVEKGAPLEVVLPSSGSAVSFRLLRGRDEKGLQKIQKTNPESRSSAYLRFRLTGVQGVKEPDWTRWLRDLSARDSSFLRAAFDEHDCGIDQEAEFSCLSCGHIWTEDVRFRADFLFPKFRGKTTSKASSASSKTSQDDRATP